MNAQSQFWIFFINRYDVFLLIMNFGITSQCPESIATVHFVNACPQSAEKWTEAAKRLNCQSISTTCTNFEYHCVMDPYKIRLIEVCAPKKLILGQFCVEYNGFGNVIQRNIKFRCKACPKMYNSTNVFEYPECFKIKTKLNSVSDITAPLAQSNDSSNKTSSDASLYFNTTAGTTSDLHHSINNGNKIGHCKDPTSVIYIVFYIKIGLALFHTCLNPRKSENSQ